MTFANFKQAPWKTSHSKYKQSALSISPAPEYASSEVLVASLYRTIGYDSATEGSVPQAGRDLDRKIQKLRDKRLPAPDGATLKADTWHTVLHGILESPKLPNQSSKRFLQITPLVPEVALFSGSARLSSNSWPAGSLLRRMVWLGSADDDSARDLWSELFRALSVGENDDVFARWLGQETQAWNDSTMWEQAPVPSNEVATLPREDFDSILFLPSRQFTKDLRAVIHAKRTMTRRQWTSLLESILRLAAATHVIWLCDVQARIWRCLFDAYEKGEQISEPEVRAQIFPASPQYMTYGGKALPGFRDRASSYLAARLGINTLLWSLDHAGKAFEGNLSSSKDIAALCNHIQSNKEALSKAGTMENLVEMREREARALNCRKGIGSNLLEFARHALGQRQTAIHLLRGYDQGYILKKKGSSASSPWVVSLGPVSVLALVHCALFGMVGPRSIHRLAQHLAAYGIAVDRHDVSRNDLGQQLRMLGLVLDSPDAESGMLLLPPFPATQARSERI
ncbi:MULTISPECIES: hypothetical protein [unclassified Marinobacter]|uniref:hypothetical protein n=1 Tax=unclassified Marinobacter TaxID=83889 RepID=UPI0018F11805|nr:MULTISPECIES: hypothetical protein [unclassified Marinobacter]